MIKWIYKFFKALGEARAANLRKNPHLMRMY